MLRLKIWKVMSSNYYVFLWGSVLEILSAFFNFPLCSLRFQYDDLDFWKYIKQCGTKLWRSQNFGPLLWNLRCCSLINTEICELEKLMIWVQNINLLRFLHGPPGFAIEYCLQRWKYIFILVFIYIYIYISIWIKVFSNVCLHVRNHSHNWCLQIWYEYTLRSVP